MLDKKKYQINFNAYSYDYKTRTYRSKDGRPMSYAEASRNKWKCEKCSQTFPNYKMLFNHKKEFHSY